MADHESSEEAGSSAEEEAPIVSFDQLTLPDPVQAGIRDAGFTLCTPIQARILPIALKGRDVAGQAQTGTGKTAAFLITLFTRLIQQDRRRKPGAPRALVIAPTRELVVQIAKDARQLGAHTGLVIQEVYGGVDYRRQRESVSREVDLLVGTPGRLIDYLDQGVYHLKSIEVLVVDEADRMFDMGFIRDLRYLVRHCPPADKRQSLLFSATLSHDVMELAYMQMNEAVKVEIKPEQVTAEGVRHIVYHVTKGEKLPMLLGVLRRTGAVRTLVFVNMRRTAEYLCRALAANGYDAAEITGDIEQRRREKALESFREGKLSVLVATDVASRGLHIDSVTHVINYDVPLDAEDYVHRVGRTARAGASGDAITLACEQYVLGLEPIEALIGFKLPFEVVEEDMLIASTNVPRRPLKRAPQQGDERGRGGGGAGGRPDEARPRPARRDAISAKPAGRAQVAVANSSIDAQLLAARGAANPATGVVVNGSSGQELAIDRRDGGDRPPGPPRRRRRRRRPGIHAGERGQRTQDAAGPAANDDSESD